MVTIDSILLTRTQQRYCAHCERTTDWHDDFGHVYCGYCHRSTGKTNAFGTPSPPQRGRRWWQRAYHTAKRHPTVFVLLCMVVASFVLAAFLDAS